MAKRKSPKFNPFLYVILRLTFIPYLLLKYRIKSENVKILKKIKPPFVLIPNHVSMFDPPIVNIFVPHRVHFVMSDANLRSKIAKWAFLKLCAVVPKTKAVSDSSAVRQLVRLVRNKRIICIFAEGRSSWDAVTHDIFFSTSKLIKILQVPVICPIISGGYLTHPRWSSNVRPGKMIVNYKKVFDGPELANLSPEEIHLRLKKELEHDDYQFQLKSGQKYRSPRGAEYLERLIFLCPECESRTSMRSEKRRFFCTICGHEWRWSDEGYLESANNNPKTLKSVTAWVKWQNEYCEKYIRKMIAINDKSAIFTDNNVTLKVGYKLEPLRSILFGKMSLYIDRFTVENEQDIKVFPINDVEGVQVLLSNKFEFYYKGSLYKFEFSNPRASGYKYMCVIQKIAPSKTELE